MRTTTTPRRPSSPPPLPLKGRGSHACAPSPSSSSVARARAEAPTPRSRSRKIENENGSAQDSTRTGRPPFLNLFALVTSSGQVIYFDSQGQPCQTYLTRDGCVAKGKVFAIPGQRVKIITPEQALQMLQIQSSVPPTAKPSNRPASLPPPLHTSPSYASSGNYAIESAPIPVIQPQLQLHLPTVRMAPPNINLAGVRGINLNSLLRQQPSKTNWLAATGLLLLSIVVIYFMWPGLGSFDQRLKEAEARFRSSYADQGVSIQGYQEVTMVVFGAGGYNPIGPVSITRATFRSFLSEMGSPALPEADTMYQACVEEGCDPSLLLAFFEHESSGGKAGVAANTHSIGNIRCTQGYTCFTTSGNGSFRSYPTWTAGVRDWAKLLQFYKNDWKRVTLEEIIPKYAPQADNNNEAAYIASVKKRVDNLRQREGIGGNATSSGSSIAVSGSNGNVSSSSSSGDQPIGNPVYESDWVITQDFSAKHPEIDIARPAAVSLGTNIHTTIGGVVTVVRNDPLFGNRVFVTGHEFTAHYNHLMSDNIPVSSGQEVKRGDLIGYMGNTGKSSGPHLDYELFQGTQRLNPMDWVLRRQ